MEYRILGATGIRVSTHCLGTMMFGAWGNTDVDECVRVVHEAIDGGINFVDTADVYSAGDSEEIVGRALAGRRDEVVLATKFHNPMGEGVNERGNSRSGSCGRSRRAFGGSAPITSTSTRCTAPRKRPTIEETLSALTDLQRAGTIRAFGSSTFPGWQIVEAQWAAERRGLERFRTEQPPYSILARHAELDVLPVAAAHRMGVLVWAPLGRGWLTGRYRRAGFDRSPDSRATRSRGPGRTGGGAVRRGASGDPGQARRGGAPRADRRAGRDLDDPHGRRLHARPPGGDVGDRGTAHARPARGPPRRARTCASTPPRSTRSTPSCPPARRSIRRTGDSHPGGSSPRDDVDRPPDRCRRRRRLASVIARRDRLVRPERWDEPRDRSRAGDAQQAAGDDRHRRRERRRHQARLEVPEAGAARHDEVVDARQAAAQVVGHRELDDRAAEDRRDHVGATRDREQDAGRARGDRRRARTRRCSLPMPRPPTARPGPDGAPA